MIKYKKYLGVLIFLFSVFGFSQEQSFWKRDVSKKLSSILYQTDLSKAEVYNLNLLGFKKTLSTKSTVLIDFPDFNEGMVTYKIYESSVMHPDLAIQYPNIKTYKGVSVNNPSNTIRFTINRTGLHAVVYNLGISSIYINPISNSNYILYKRGDMEESKSFECLVEENASISKTLFEKKVSGDLTLRTFELALATTGEYSQFHINQAGVSNGTETEKRAAVMNAVVVAINRVNEIFERDLALTFQLIPNTDLLFYLDGATDPYSNGNGVAMLSENQTNIDNVIGSSNYDIGHVFSTGGGGVATLQSPCSGGKARGVTGQASPIGDSFSVDYVAHEIGHQFGANHTFNGTAGSCLDNRNSNTAVEPGSGTTIMSYAGLCAPQNVQPLVNDYFHTISIQEMTAFITSTSTACDEENALTNNFNTPVANAGPDFTVPKSTPLILKGSGSDGDGDILSYSWEQTDNQVNGISNPPVSTQAVGSVFRSLSPNNSPDRYLPELTTVLSGDLSSTWEVLPSVGRTMDFTLTVRDNVLNGGQIGIDNTRVTVDDNSGPFEITSQNANEVFWASGTQETITWDVANTDIAPVNSPNVNILLSLDGGMTYPISLVNGTPNDGIEEITVPNGITTNGRIKIEGANHIFYAVNKTDIQVTNDFALSIPSPFKKVCAPDDVVYTIDLNFATGFSEEVVLSADNVPSGANLSFEPITASVTSSIQLTIGGSENIAVGFYEIDIIGTSTSVTRNSKIQLEVFNSSIAPPVLLNPATGSNDVLAKGTSFSWNNDVNTETYTIEIATDANFSSIIENATTTTNSYTPINLVDATTYYWRVKLDNLCASGDYSEIGVFTTSEIICYQFNATDTPINIPDDTANGVNSILNINDNVVINDINVTININHSWMRDLIITLESPSGTKITLLERQCRGNTGNVNMEATFDDDGELLECANSSPVINGIILPTELLSQFNGESSQGNWTLNVSDVAPDDIGSLLSWSIEICESKAVATVEGETFGNLAIWPNPSEEIVNISFTSIDQNATEIKLFDVLGRLIMSKTYQSNSVVFQENLSIKILSSGLYFIEIMKGKKSTTKRLIKK